MSKSYYYFVASLPTIEFNSSSAMSCEDFLEQCQRLVSPEDCCLLNSLFSDSGEVVSSENKTYQAWLRFFQGFENTLVLFRAERAHKDPAKILRGEVQFSSVFGEMIHQVTKTDNLLEAEKMMDSLLWDFLDNLETGQFYNLDYLIVYALKLKIVDRYAKINSTRGREIFEEVKQIDYTELLEV